MRPDSGQLGHRVPMDAWEEFHEAFPGLTLAVNQRAYRLRTLPAAVREDVVGEVWKVVIENWDQLATFSQGRREGWVITVANREAVNYIRERDRERRLQERLGEPSVEPAADQILDQLPSHFWPALYRLPERQQHVVALRHLIGMTRHEVAEELGITVNSVKTHDQRALRRLRTYVHRYGLGSDGNRGRIS